MDSKPVHLITTFKPARTECVRNTKDKKSGAWNPITIPRPTTIPVYNANMGGTDKQDQFGSYYEDRKRSLRWQGRLISHFMHVAAINGHIFYKENPARVGRFGMILHPTMTLLQFQTALIKSWCYPDHDYSEDEYDSAGDSSEWSDDLSSDESDEDVVVVKRPKAWWTTPEGYAFRVQERHHYPETVPNVDRKQCVLCPRKCNSRCKKCNAFLCLNDSSQERKCFEKFHTIENVFR